MVLINVQARLENYLKAHNVRESKTRGKILSLFNSSGRHVELSTLIATAKKNGIGEASVYRSLKLFQAAGVISRIQKPGGQTFYELADAHHDHMICTICDKIFEFHSTAIEKLQEAIAKRAKFLIQSHNHEMFGVCVKCQKSAT